MDGAVQVQFGLKKFFIYFFLSAFLGLFANNLIQKHITKVWKESQAQLTEKNITSDKPTIVFSKSGWPVVGANVTLATFRTSLQCYGFVTNIEDIYIPIPLMQLFTGHLRFGSVDVGRMKVEMQEDPACLDINPNSLNSAQTDEVVKSTDSSQVAPNWFGILEKWFSTDRDFINQFPVPRVRVNQIEFEGSTSSGKSLMAQGEADFIFQDKLNLDIRFRPIEFKKNKQALSTNFQSHLIADESQIQVNADWGYDEGHVLLDLNYKKEDGVANINLKTQDLPLSVVNRWFDTPWAFQFLWFNCDLHMASSKEAWDQSQWGIKDCQVNGPHGRLRVKSQKLQSLNRPSGLSFEIFNFDLDKILKGKEKMPLDGVFKSLGVVDGEAQIDGNNLTSRLVLKNAQIIFSRKNQRKLQVVDEMKMEIGYHKSIYSLMINDAKIQNGLFEGFVALDYNKHLNRTSSKIAIDRIQFSPEVQQLMWEGTLSPVAVTGEINLNEKFRIELAKFNVNFKSYETPGLVANAGTLLLDWNQEDGSLTTTLAQLKVTKGAGYPWLFAPFLDETVTRDVLVVSRLYSIGHFEKTHFVIDKLIANAANQRLSITGEITKRNAQGQWDWGVQPKHFAWKWIYSDQQFTLIPLIGEMKEWLKLNDSYLEEYPFIRMESSDI